MHLAPSNLRSQTVEAVVPKLESGSLHRDLEMYSDAEVEAIRRAADFLFAARRYTNAFELYILLMKIMTIGRTPETIDEQVEVNDILFYLAQSCMTLSQCEIAKHLIKKRLKYITALVDAPGKAVLFSALLGQICWTQGDRQEAHWYFRQASQNLSQAARMSPERLNRRLLATLNCRGEVIGSNMDAPFSYSKAKLVHINDEKRGALVRSCVRWCTKKLNAAPTFPIENSIESSWEAMPYTYTDHRRLTSRRLFCTLWQFWYAGHFASFSIDKLDYEWVDGSEQILGICVAEYLAAIALLIVNQCDGALFTPGVRPEEIMTKLLSSTSSLATQSEVSLGRQFSLAYTQLHFMAADHMPLNNMAYTDYYVGITDIVRRNFAIELAETGHTSNTRTMPQSHSYYENEAEEEEDEDTFRIAPQVLSLLEDDLPLSSDHDVAPYLQSGGNLSQAVISVTVSSPDGKGRISTDSLSLRAAFNYTDSSSLRQAMGAAACTTTSLSSKMSLMSLSSLSKMSI